LVTQAIASTVTNEPAIAQSLESEIPVPTAGPLCAELIDAAIAIRHHSLGNQLIVPMAHPPDTGNEIETTERLGGLFRSYRRAA
jgi:hypothetical protein